MSARDFTGPSRVRNHGGTSAATDTDTIDDPPHQDDDGLVTTDTVGDYLRQIGRAPMLDAADEVELCKRIEAGVYADHLLAGPDVDPDDRDALEWIAQDGLEAQQQLLGSNLRLVVSIARRYIGHRLPFLDLIQEGNLGLIRAMQKFDYQLGNRFSTYATWWIKQNVTRANATQGRAIRVPTNVAQLLTARARARAVTLEETGREATAAELATVLEISEQAVLDLETYDQEPLSLDAPLEAGSAVTVTELVPDPGPGPFETTATTLLPGYLHAALSRLPEREAGIVALHAGLVDDTKRSWTEIGSAYGLSRERARQLAQLGLARLRAPEVAAHLAEYLTTT